MAEHFLSIALLTLLAPLLGAIIAGLLGMRIGRKAVHTISIFLVGCSFVGSCYLFAKLVLQGQPAQNYLLYHWVSSGAFQFNIGILLDRLSATMLFVVTFVSLMVHIYTVGYMATDTGYQRFFSYVSLFTFAMLTLVLANNFLLLFFGWEGVGLVSYLLIGFWFNREAAVNGSLKAFLVNRIGDIGLVLGIAAVLKYSGSVDYQTVFQHVPHILSFNVEFFPGYTCSAVTLICILLFVGAMGKSAQVPLHVWLPESMEGPTPISALIHAATMVTAGIYLVARCSPLFEYSVPALSMIIVIGAITCLTMGILALVQFDIKRVIAYSTLSQLGYMTVALGASAYDAAIFHLITHAFFKALLFLAAGSVILALHHEQDMRKMGGLAKYLPITYLTFLIGAISLSALPPFAGFFSKDAIIAAVHLAKIPGANFAYYCVLSGAFITPLYIFRAVFLTFHGKTKLSNDTLAHLHESPWVVLLPLILLAIPSIIAGGALVGPMLLATPRLLGNSIFILPQHNVLASLAQHHSGAIAMIMESVHSLTLWLALLGIVAAWFFNLGYPSIIKKLQHYFAWIYRILLNKYGFDEFNQRVIVKGTRGLGRFFYKITDLKMIDGVFVNGSGKAIRWLAKISCRIQTGYVYDYAFIMIIGLGAFLSWLLLGF
jgi:NADH-quinone oxidoreductase subunit L